MKDTEKDLLQFCSKLLYKKADFTDTDDLYWISFGYGDNETYCYNCCQKEVDKINQELIINGKNPTIVVDGGWEGIDEDSCVFCESCGKRLEVSLTKYGVESEVDHFLEHKLTDISNGELIELHNIFECSVSHKFDEQYEKDLLKLADTVLCILGESMGIEDRFELLDL